MTFEPHPRDYFAGALKKPELAPARIATLRDKLTELERCGVQQVVVLPFDARLASARTWIFTLVRNRRIDLERAAQRDQRLVADYARNDGGVESYEVDLLSQAFGARVGAMLGQLPAEQREVLIKCYVEGKSQREIAQESGVPIGTVKSRARLAFERVRAAFGEAR